MRFKTILLFGIPGSGKGTQGRILGSIPGFRHCACGDVFRSINANSELGKVFTAYSARGELVPDEFVIELWEKRILSLEASGDFQPQRDMLVLDGIPRNVAQARLLGRVLDVQAVVHLSCSDPEAIIDRLRRRAVKENRLDDARDDVIQRRLAVYDEQTRPILRYYPDHLILKVDATASQMRVAAAILNCLAGTMEQSMTPRHMQEFVPQYISMPS